jgi:hypothetical protein
MKEIPMTNEERITQLEARLAAAERRIAELEARPVTPVYAPLQPEPFRYPAPWWQNPVTSICGQEMPQGQHVPFDPRITVMGMATSGYNSIAS